MDSERSDSTQEQFDEGGVGGGDPASSGYPEEQPGGVSGGSEGEGGGGDRGGERDNPAGADESPGDATGNPHAAG